MADKKWYIRDEAISEEADDAFSHLDFARELRLKIDELPLPLTIALSGEHGTGKSCIGFLLEKQFQVNPGYEFIRIEAWRHEGESRRKAFLHDVVEILKLRSKEGSEQHKELSLLHQGLYSAHARQTAVLDLTGAKDSVRVIWKELNKRAIQWGAGLGFAIVALLIIWYFATVHSLPATALASLWSTSPSLLSLPITVSALGYFGSLAKQLSEKVLEPAKITISSSPPSSAEQFEQAFRKALSISLGDASKRLVIFIDELDRLAPSEIIEALKAIRTFRDVTPCVFVVALDEEVVKRALVDSTAVGLATIQRRPRNSSISSSSSGSTSPCW